MGLVGNGQASRLERRSCFSHTVILLFCCGFQGFFQWDEAFSVGKAGNELSFTILLQGGFELQVPQLALQSGRLFVPQGENGSGKSPLLRLLAKYLRHRWGRE